MTDDWKRMSVVTNAIAYELYHKNGRERFLGANRTRMISVSPEESILTRRIAERVLSDLEAYDKVKDILEEDKAVNENHRLSDQQVQDYAEFVIKDHATDVEFTSIFEMYELWDGAEDEEISEEDARRVADEIQQATVTVEW